MKQIEKGRKEVRMGEMEGKWRKEDKKIKINNSKERKNTRSNFCMPA